MYFWGPHFPPKAKSDWDGHFPDGSVDPNYFQGYGPDGVATFALDLEAGFTVTYTWVTDIIKRYSGTEQRIAINDAPKQNYSGSAILLNSQPRSILTALARYAAVGSTFLLGLPHEELTLVASSSGSTVYVSATHLLLCDWAHVGQRVIVMDLEGNYIKAVVQGTGPGGEIYLDQTPGSVGRTYGRIMPVMAIYLHPQQGFIRHPVEAEEWQINARAAIFDFASDPATLALGPITSSAALENVSITSRIPGLDGNKIMINFYEGSGYPNAGSLVESDFEVQIGFKGGVTTLAQIATLLLGSQYIKLTGTWTGSDILPSGTSNDISGAYLTGGVGSAGVGAGATITTYESRPVWDREIQVDGTAGDSIQALTEILDTDGVPYAIGSADYVDWGRSLFIRRTSRLEWQWFKKFVATVRGRQRAWWLPSYRRDLEYVSHTSTTIRVNSDVLAWWPDQRSHIRVVQQDGTTTFMKITAAVTNTDGTCTVTINTTLSVSAITAICWLELCRFESDDFQVEFNGPQFKIATQARVVRA